MNQDHPLLKDLTPAQCEAVTHIDGPLLVLAGAGSGKTRVITRRVAYLLDQGIDPSRILSVTFTNKAAGEMRQRIQKLKPDTSVWISTFHSLGARLLRQYAERLDLDRNFTIYDQTDRKRLTKMAMEDVGLDSGKVTPEAVQAGISKAKNQLLSPRRFAQRAHGFVNETIALVYPAYEKRLRDSNALDFDDLLYWPALAMKNDPELREELDSRFRYILIDEYQDTNQAQYALSKGLSHTYQNICIVGDPDQCLPPETEIETPEGRKRIEDLKEGDLVISGAGWNKTLPRPIEKVMVNPYSGPLVRITVEGGHSFRATPNHICFGKLQPRPELHYTYLMWKRGVGFRIGTTRGVRSSKDREILSGLQVRTNQEVADAIWILHSAHSLAEALYHEQFYSVKYGIPTMVFFVRGRKMEMTQDWVDRLYREVDSEAGAARLMADLHLDRRYPHHRPGAVTRNGWARLHVHFNVFGGSRPARVRGWHEHRIQFITSDQEIRQLADQQFATREGNKDTWRIETSRSQYDEAQWLAEDICGLDERIELIPRARLTEGKTFPFLPASHLHPGMVVPVCEDGQIVERTIERVEWETYEGPVYDLSIPDTRNYIANGVAVHNSIYGWRGSDIRNILDFERDYPNAKVLTLNMNYRSTRSILHAASVLIANNKDRKEKDLITENNEGAPVEVLTFENGLEEASGIMKRIHDAVENGKRKYRDFAIFVRVNALTRSLEKAAVQHEVPYQIVRGLAFFDRKENRDVISYLRALVNPRDDISFERAVNEPSRGVGKVTLAHLRNYAVPRDLSLLEAAYEVDRIPEIKGKAARGLKQFTTMMKELHDIREGQPHEVIEAVLDKSGYRVMLKDSRDEEDEERLANIEELITAAKQFAEEDSTRTIGDFLENITLASDVDGWDEQQDCVSIMTLHAAKGLEFPVVYMIAVENGILPHQRSLDPDRLSDLEEERRLTFVGMTRAKEELYLCHGRMREYRGQILYAIPSLFLEELPPDVERNDVSSSRQRVSIADQWRQSSSSASKPGWEDAGVDTPQLGQSTAAGPYKVGMLVKHENYGKGRIIEISGQGVLRKMKIRFASKGVVPFIVKYAKLEIIEE